MSRTPFQVLVLLRRLGAGQTEYLAPKRSGTGVWQGIAGGGKNDGSPREATARETLEKTGIATEKLAALQSVSMVPVLGVAGCYQWGDFVPEIPEHVFCADIDANANVRLSEEHADY
ncbi:NUDIX domain-containing protein [Adlercreutzia sp. R21]|uniref:NUDIX domain-containing protein n=1 Tax=Adlercreutzia wanghongyangiae TaxID=3111451 RepID=UPI002DBFE259|nr:NUDIX domain-containing protein [Adlercreutzia sp. R21]MEC4183885.1 NUDIX domain-containing protein [Adlercreutzia sp. R21]